MDIASTIERMGNRPVVVYHDSCPDGVAAAWACRRRFQDAEMYPAKYSDEPDINRLRDRDVIVVDFSWKRAPMLSVAEVASSIVVLDHHKSAELELSGLEFAVFDEEQSGCGLAWRTLFPSEPMPETLSHIEDRDLWRFALPATKAFMASFSLHDLTIDLVGEFVEAIQASDGDYSRFVAEGHAVLRYHERLVEDACHNPPMETINGIVVPCVPCHTKRLISDIGHKLAEKAPFSATYQILPDGSRIYNLRSRDDGADVQEIAVALGGGGHKHAAGFKTAAP